MRKAISYLLAIFVFTLSMPLQAADKAPTEREYEKNYDECNDKPIGYSADKATNRTISMSMMGWGLGLAIAIAIVAGVIHQSAGAHLTQPTNTNSSS